MPKRKNPVALDVAAINIKEYTQEMNGGGWKRAHKKPTKLKYKIRTELQSSDRMSEPEVRNLLDIWNISFKNKWRLYRYWTDR